MPRMGDLAATDVYNAFDVPLEQSTNVGWANRMGEILTARPPDNPAVAYKTPYFDITEGDIGRATEAALGVSGGGLSTKGIKAYHSSPHDFERFDLSKIGTGEGAQVYGHGLYFAESPAVSGQGGQYWNQFLNRFEGHERDAAGILQRAGFDREAAIRANQKDINQFLEHHSDKLGVDLRYDAALERMRKEHALLTDKQPVGPRTYEVNINADPAHMLDWDRPLREQSKLHEGLEQVFNRDEILQQPSGRHLYDTLISEYSSPTASAMLGDVGIPGIKYLDQGSRGPAQTIELLKKNLEKPGWLPETRASLQSQLDELLKKPPPSSNYVVFDPGIIDIMKKYGIAGAAPVGMGALAAQDRYE